MFVMRISRRRVRPSDESEGTVAWRDDEEAVAWRDDEGTVAWSDDEGTEARRDDEGTVAWRDDEGMVVRMMAVLNLDACGMMGMKRTKVPAVSLLKRWMGATKWREC